MTALIELDKNRVSSYLSREARNRLSAFDVLKTTTSTNDELLNSQFLQANKFFVCMANQQSAGRGRNGKVWQSPPNAHIYMSIGTVFDVSLVNDLAGLSLACGVTVVRLLKTMGFQAGLKWPNDVLVDDKKLAGILVETRIKRNQVMVVVGIGLNVDMPESAELNIEQPWTDLNTLISNKAFHAVDNLLEEKSVNRNFVAATLVEKIMQSMSLYAESGFETFNEDWNQFDVLSGRDVVVKTNHQEFAGHVIGFNRDHSVLVKINDQVKSFYAADIKLKLNAHVSR